MTALGMVGLGRMGGNMARRLRQGGHRVVATTRDPERLRQAVASDGVEGADNIAALCARLEVPRIVWLMLPAGDATATAIDAAAAVLDAGDILVDGGNAHWRDSVARARTLAGRGVHFLDAGVSGGIWGLSEGYCLMIGGPRVAFDRAEPILRTLAPPDGYLHVGESGAGHFVKMVHNGIEYALMQAYGEGFELLERSGLGLDLPRIAALWNRGSVVRSWLLELATRALAANPRLDGISGWVEDSGEGRWTVLQAVESGVPTPAIAQALFQRFASRQPDAFGLRLIAALRDEFGGHGVHRPSDVG